MKWKPKPLPLVNRETGRGDPIEIDGLWALCFDRDDKDHDGRCHDEDDAVLYFVAGPEDEARGLAGKIAPGRQRH